MANVDNPELATQLEALKGTRVNSVVEADGLLVLSELSGKWVKYPETITYMPGHPVHDYGGDHPLIGDPSEIGMTKEELDAWDAEAFVHGTLVEVVHDNGVWVRLEDVYIEDGGSGQTVLFDASARTATKPVPTGL